MPLPPLRGTAKNPVTGCTKQSVRRCGSRWCVVVEQNWQRPKEEKTKQKPKFAWSVRRGVPGLPVVEGCGIKLGPGTPQWGARRVIFSGQAVEGAAVTISGEGLTSSQLIRGSKHSSSLVMLVGSGDLPPPQ